MFKSSAIIIVQGTVPPKYYFQVYNEEGKLFAKGNILYDTVEEVIIKVKYYFHHMPIHPILVEEELLHKEPGVDGWRPNKIKEQNESFMNQNDYRFKVSRSLSNRGMNSEEFTILIDRCFVNNMSVQDCVNMIVNSRTDSIST